MVISFSALIPSAVMRVGFFIKFAVKGGLSLTIYIMSNNIKLSVTILGIPGATRHLVGKSRKEWFITKQDVSKEKLDPHEGAKVLRKGKYTSNDYEYIPCSQRINMTEDAYEEFTSRQKPYWFKNPYDWVKKSKTERLELHLSRICHSLNGTSFTYNVFDD